MDKIFRVLSDPTRRAILRLLRSGDMSAGEIAQHFSIAKSTLSGHFNLLKDARLLVTERRGTTVVYSLNVSVYEEMVEAVRGLVGVGAKRAPSGKTSRGDAHEPAG